MKTIFSARALNIPKNVFLAMDQAKFKARDAGLEV